MPYGQPKTPLPQRDGPNAPLKAGFRPHLPMRGDLMDQVKEHAEQVATEVVENMRRECPAMLETIGEDNVEKLRNCMTIQSIRYMSRLLNSA